MNIYEAIGIAFVLFFTLLGVAIFTWLAFRGVKSLRNLLDVAQDEDGPIPGHLDMARQKSQLAPR